MWQTKILLSSVSGAGCLRSASPTNLWLVNNQDASECRMDSMISKPIRQLWLLHTDLYLRNGQLVILAGDL